MTIPNNIFQTGLKKPEQYVVDKIMSKCKGWTYQHFDDNEIKQFFAEHYVEEFKDVGILFDKISCGQHKADLFRYYFLYVKGGVFFDDDAMIEIDIKEVIQDHKFFSVNSIAVKKYCVSRIYRMRTKE